LPLEQVMFEEKEIKYIEDHMIFFLN